VLIAESDFQLAHRRPAYSYSAPIENQLLINANTIPNAATIAILLVLAVINYFESEPASDSTRIVAVAWTVA